MVWATSNWKQKHGRINFPGVSRLEEEKKTTTFAFNSAGTLTQKRSFSIPFSWCHVYVQVWVRNSIEIVAVFMFGSAVYSSVKQYIDWKWWCFHIRVSIYKPKFLSDPGPAIVPFHQWLILGPCRIWTFSNAESKKISSTLFQDVICEIEIAQFCGFWSSRKNLPNFPLSVLRHRRYITHFILYMMIQTKQTMPHSYLANMLVVVGCDIFAFAQHSSLKYT